MPWHKHKIDLLYLQYEVPSYGPVLLSVPEIGISPTVFTDEFSVELMDFLRKLVNILDFMGYFAKYHKSD